MAREKEIKIELQSLPLKSFEKRIEAAGFKPITAISQEDIYFDTIDWYLYEHLAALRVRKVNGKFDSFSFKKMFYLPDRLDHYHIEELEMKFPLTDKKTFTEIVSKLKLNDFQAMPKNGDKLIESLRSFGYFDDQHMCKVRQVYKNGDNEIVIDDVEEVGTIIELECQEDEPLELAHTFLSADEWQRSTEGTSYKWLTKMKGLKTHIDNLNRFEKEPTWNIWEHEVEMYERL
jgi:adenylate cyclase class IV